MEIGIISDTHSYIDDRIIEHLKDCDEIWHAGDIGDEQVTDALKVLAPLRVVYGNIDNGKARIEFPEEQIFTIEGVKIYMIHIGGYPPRYTPKLKRRLDELNPDLFICGHSHILKVIPDKTRNLIHINPGAAGRHGFHQMRTLIKLTIKDGKPQNLRVVELGKRASIQ
ncbi:metallophosphoesterase family protein [Flammeovirga sp. MY04]|uniref:metallophosphoesterase family protein n=1 Tax=Flammeovirga sp. MY04 TaxID=1191459 RepID=UPI0008061846|nr:metallophosphoesterase family protein [Flammeovirga sp. MY04]ANQ47501.1 metallophosphoesterase family protein [Flammeovirga sp. MY04]